MSNGEGYMADEKKDYTTAVKVWHVILILSVMASVAVNTAHGVLGAQDNLTARIVAGALGAIPPIVFFALVEALLKTFRAGVYGWLYWTLIGGTVTAATAAFTLSFIAVLDFARDYAVMSSMWIAWLFPIMFDVVMALSTLAIFALGDKPMKRVRKAKERKDESAIASIGFFPKWKIRLVGGAATVPTVPMTAERQVIDTPSLTPERRFNDSPSTPTPVVNRASPTPVVVAKGVTDVVANTDIDADTLAFATVVGKRAKVKQSPETVHRVIEALRASGGNISHAASVVGLSRGPARSIRDALAEIDAQEEPVLSAVG